jgi:hypothetical protein
MIVVLAVVTVPDTFDGTSRRYLSITVPTVTIDDALHGPASFHSTFDQFIRSWHLQKSVRSKWNPLTLKQQRPSLKW